MIYSEQHLSLKLLVRYSAFDSDGLVVDSLQFINVDKIVMYVDEIQEFVSNVELPRSELEDVKPSTRVTSPPNLPFVHDNEMLLDNQTFSEFFKEAFKGYPKGEPKSLILVFRSPSDTSKYVLDESFSEFVFQRFSHISIDGNSLTLQYYLHNKKSSNNIVEFKNIKLYAKSSILSIKEKFTLFRCMMNGIDIENSDKIPYLQIQSDKQIEFNDVTFNSLLLTGLAITPLDSEMAFKNTKITLCGIRFNYASKKSDNSSGLFNIEKAYLCELININTTGVDIPLIPFFKIKDCTTVKVCDYKHEVLLARNAADIVFNHVYEISLNDIVINYNITSASLDTMANNIISNLFSCIRIGEMPVTSRIVCNKTIINNCNFIDSFSSTIGILKFIESKIKNKHGFKQNSTQIVECAFNKSIFDCEDIDWTFNKISITNSDVKGLTVKLSVLESLVSNSTFIEGSTSINLRIARTAKILGDTLTLISDILSISALPRKKTIVNVKKTVKKINREGEEYETVDDVPSEIEDPKDNSVIDIRGSNFKFHGTTTLTFDEIKNIQVSTMELKSSYFNFNSCGIKITEGYIPLKGLNTKIRLYKCAIETPNGFNVYGVESKCDIEMDTVTGTIDLGFSSTKNHSIDINMKNCLLSMNYRKVNPDNLETVVDSAIQIYSVDCIGSTHFMFDKSILIVPKIQCSDFNLFLEGSEKNKDKIVYGYK